MRVLLVDDEEHVLRATMRVFRRHPHYSLVPVRTAAEALELLASSHFDAAIVDHHLASELSGAQLLRIMAQRWPAVRRVMCSGGVFGPADDPSAGCAQAVLMKPATVEELIAAIDGEAEELAAAS